MHPHPQSRDTPGSFGMRDVHQGSVTSMLELFYLLGRTRVDARQDGRQGLGFRVEARTHAHSAELCPRITAVARARQTSCIYVCIIEMRDPCICVRILERQGGGGLRTDGW